MPTFAVPTVQMVEELMQKIDSIKCDVKPPTTDVQSMLKGVHEMLAEKLRECPNNTELLALKEKLSMTTVAVPTVQMLEEVMDTIDSIKCDVKPPTTDVQEQLKEVHEKLAAKLRECPNNTELLALKEKLGVSAGTVPTVQMLEEVMYKISSIKCDAVRPPTTDVQETLKEVHEKLAAKLKECPNNTELLALKEKLSMTTAAVPTVQMLEELAEKIDSIKCDTNKPPTTDVQEMLKEVHEKLAAKLRECPNNTELLALKEKLSMTTGAVPTAQMVEEVMAKVDSIKCDVKPPTTDVQEMLKEVRAELEAKLKECPKNDELLALKEKVMSSNRVPTTDVLEQLKEKIGSIKCDVKPPTTDVQEMLKEVHEELAEKLKECPKNDELLALKEKLSMAAGTVPTVRMLEELVEKIDSIKCDVKPPTTDVQEMLKEVRAELEQKLKECPKNDELLALKEKVMSSNRVPTADVLEQLKEKIVSIKCDVNKPPTTDIQEMLKEVHEELAEKLRECPNNTELLALKEKLSMAAGTVPTVRMLEELVEKIDSIKCDTNKPPTTDVQEQLKEIRDELEEKLEECPKNDDLLALKEKLASSANGAPAASILDEVQKRLDSIKCDVKPPTTNVQEMLKEVRAELEEKLKLCPKNDNLLALKEKLLSLFTSIPDAQTLGELKEKIESIKCDTNKPPTTDVQEQLKEIRDELEEMLKECPKNDELLALKEKLASSDKSALDASILDELKKRLDSVKCDTNKPPTTDVQEQLKEIRDELEEMLKECPKNDELLALKEKLASSKALDASILDELKKRLDAVKCDTNKPPTTDVQEQLKEVRADLEKKLKECPKNDELLALKEKTMSSNRVPTADVLEQLKEKIGSIKCDVKPPTTTNSTSDCIGRVSLWEDDKREACCITQRLGCKPVQEFSCRATDSDPLTGWDRARKAYCCAHHQQACDDLKEKLFDCTYSVDATKKPWTAVQRKWCCEKEKQHCPDNAAEEKRRLKDVCMDLEESRTLRENKTLAEKCCKKFDIGCPAPHDCFDLTDKDTWASEKSVWCCRYKDVCQTDCTAPVSDMSADDKDFCCTNKGGRACTTDYDEKEKKRDASNREDDKNNGKKGYGVSVKLHWSVDDIFQSPKHTLCRLRSTLVFASDRLQQDPSALLVTFFAALLPDGTEPSQTQTEWIQRTYDAWNEECIAEERTRIKNGDVSNVVSRVAIVLGEQQSNNPSTGISAHLLADSEDLTEDIMATLSSESSSLPLLADPKAVDPHSSTEKEKESESKKSDSKGWLWAILGVVGALCMGSAIAAVIVHRRQKRRDEELYTTVMTEQMHDVMMDTQQKPDTARV